MEATFNISAISIRILMIWKADQYFDINKHTSGLQVNQISDEIARTLIYICHEHQQNRRSIINFTQCDTDML